jgi:hypothetical protein
MRDRDSGLGSTTLLAADSHGLMLFWPRIRMADTD